jgi:choline dehydrogenase-like flavoprotein
MLGPALTAALDATTTEVLRTESCDALVVGAGAAGGLAALLLVEAGLRVLVLEAGLRTPTIPDPARQPIQSRCYAWHHAPEAYVDDLDCPYTTPPDHPFVWVRCRQIGGRLIVPGHGRQYYRLAPDDFAPADGLSPPWPLQAADLDLWYAAVERRLSLAGRNDDVSWLPNSELATVLEPTPDEVALQWAIRARWPAAQPVLGRFAAPPDTLEAAALTRRLLVRSGAIAREIEVDKSGRVSGIVWVDRESHSEHRAQASLVFVCASALESTRLLLLSRSARCPDGLGASSGVLGRNLMDHVWCNGVGDGPPPLQNTTSPDQGRCLYLPRFDARDFRVPFDRGFGIQLYQSPISPERSYFIAASFGEMLPRPENRVTLDSERRDAWSIPVLRIDCAHSGAELMRGREQIAAIRALAEAMGATLTSLDDLPAPPGAAMHECGTARMGSNPDDSVLDSHNQCWDAKGLYVTDGACFPSQGAQNPTLTILALTARACDRALQTRRA